jgi:hypothetical protein
MSLRERIEALTGIESFRWGYIGNAADSNIGIWFEHTPSNNRPEGQPLSWEQIEALNRAFNVESVESHSDGRTGSKLLVEISDPHES